MAKPRRRPARATGLGGVFLRSKSPVKLAAWYRRNLGLQIPVGQQFTAWTWRPVSRRPAFGQTVWAALATREREWGPGRPTAQVNYRVDDLDRLLNQLRRAGVSVDSKIEASEFGRFGWATDPEGNRFELWEPPKNDRPPARPTSMQ